MRLLENILKNLRQGPATRQYPFERRDAFPGARGHLQNDIKTCIFCGVCQKRCPADAIVVSKDPKTWVLDPYRCIICGYCVDACPKKCLSMAPEHRPPIAG